MKEYGLVLELCKLYSDNQNIIETYLSDSDLDLAMVLGQLQFNRVGGIAYEVLKNYGLLKSLNREIRNSLKTTYQNNLIKTKEFLNMEAYFAELLMDVKFSYALLKGAYLVQLYPNGLRTSNDIDVLIDEQDLSRIESILKNAGFLQGNIRNDEFNPATREEIIASRINRGETVPWIKEVNWPVQKYIEVDLNFSLDYKAIGSMHLTKSLLNHVYPGIDSKNGTLYTLCPEDFFIHLCTHLYKEATTMAWVKMKRDLSLYKFVDIYLCINQFFNKEFIERLYNRIEETKLRKECYYAVYRTKELFDLENTFVDSLLEKFSNLDKSSLNRIYDPVTDQEYLFNVSFKEWVFLPNRTVNLKKLNLV